MGVAREPEIDAVLRFARFNDIVRVLPTFRPHVFERDFDFNLDCCFEVEVPLGLALLLLIFLAVAVVGVRWCWDGVFKAVLTKVLDLEDVASELGLGLRLSLKVEGDASPCLKKSADGLKWCC